MMQLVMRGRPHNIRSPLVGRVSLNPDVRDAILVVRRDEDIHERDGSGWTAMVTGEEGSEVAAQRGCPAITNVADVSGLGVGDVLLLGENGRVDVLFRASSTDNALFVTDRCNSNCIMCSQPPKDIDDIEYHFAANRAAIPLIPKTTRQLGITGGEPTLLGARLGELLRLLGSELPDTEIHMLTNGRAFAWPNVARTTAAAAGRKTVFGVPLYCDYYAQHDYVVQARDAFAQTVLGLHRLAAHNARVELRVVLHRQTYARLPALARYIHRTLPFAEHIAFMGMEYCGYVPHNDSLLWMEPTDYVGELADAVEYLDDFGFRVSIYNLPLCLVPRELEAFVRVSISDWKREYLAVCDGCGRRSECGGVFGTARRHSEKIRPF